MQNLEDAFRSLAHHRHDAATRGKTWTWIAEFAKEVVFSRAQRESLWHCIEGETETQILAHALRCIGIADFYQRDRETSDDSLQQTLLAPFVSSGQAGADQHRSAAVVAVREKSDITDVQSLIQLARAMPEDRKTTFNFVALPRPNWDETRLHELDAVCFVGRPAMFSDCGLLQSLAAVEPHFSLPGDGGKGRGQPLTASSAESYHHVRQKRRGHLPLLFKAQPGDLRTDYAIVQRYVLPNEGRKTSVLVLAGTTRLGTYGAVHWLTSKDFKGKDLRGISEGSLEHIGSNTPLELLLKITGYGSERGEERPWQIKSCTEEKLILRGGLNLLEPVTRIVIVTAGSIVDEVEFLRVNDEELRRDSPKPFGGKCYDVLLAICWTANATASEVINLDALAKNSKAWLGGKPPEEKLPKYIRDHLKIGPLRAVLSVTKVSEGNTGGEVTIGFSVAMERPRGTS